ncbi:hypothetical protein [Streptomyces sp. NPDC002785]
MRFDIGTGIHESVENHTVTGQIALGIVNRASKGGVKQACCLP